MLALTAAVLGAGPASAATAPVVYDKVEITGTPPKQIGDVFRLHIEWSIADGAAISGDTFSVALDPALRGIPSTFDVTNPAGEAIANCQVKEDIVTCAFTSFVTSHPNNIKGTFDFSAAAIEGATEYNIAGKIVGLNDPVPPSGGGGGDPQDPGDKTVPMPEFSKVGSVFQDGTIGFQVKIPYSLLTAGGSGDVRIVDDYDIALGSPTRIHIDKESTGLNPPAGVGLSEGPDAGQYTLTKDDANHRFTIVYHDISTLQSNNFLKMDYSFDAPANTPAGTPFDNEVTVGSESKTIQVVYNVGGTGTGDGTGLGRARVLKVDASDHTKTLAGASFNLLDSSNKVVGTIGATGTDGKAVSLTFNPGSYTIVETIAPPGYRLDKTPHPVTLVAGATTPVTIEDARIPTGSLKISKTVTGDVASTVPSSARFAVNYSYTVDGTPTNGTLNIADGGNQTLTDLPDGTEVTLSESTPAAISGATWGSPAFTGTGVTQTGSTAKVTVVGNQTIKVGLENTITSNPAPAIDLVKTADKTKYGVGDTVTYTFKATNTGNRTLSNVQITDTAFNGSGSLSSLSCDKAAPVSLAPGAKLTCTATYVATQIDLNRGNLANTGHAVGTPPTGSNVTDDDSVTISGDQHPSIKLVKTADRTNIVAGQTITYTFKATNNGNTTLTNATITDTVFNGSGALGALTCDKTAPVTLAPGAVLTCTATYVATQIDVDRGNLANTGHAVGTPPTGTDVTSDDNVTINGTRTSSIDLVKTADKTNLVAGQTVTYTFKATNNGNTTLTNATITDTAFNGSGSLSALTCDKNAPVTLAPGAVLTCTATYVATQTDVDRGNLANTGHVVATPPSGADVTDDDSVTISSTQSPAIDLVKTASRSTYVVGDSVTYTFKATNTGNRTLTKVAITDTAFNGSGALSALTCDQNAPVTLAPGAVLTCTATYAATQADLNRGNLTNTGHAVGTPPTGSDVTDDDSVTISGSQHSSIDLVKTADRTNVVAGQTVTYTFKATNNGNTTLTAVAITDTAFNGSGSLSALTCDKASPVTLAPGVKLTCTATYVVTQADVDRGNLANTGHVVATPPTGTDVTDDDSVTINGTRTSSIDLVKTADRTKFGAGDTVTYTFKATNTGNTTLTAVAITDTAFNGSGTLNALACDKNAPVSLAPHEVLTCTATYVATQADVDRANLANTGHAVGTPPTGADVTDNDNVTITSDQAPSIDLVKRADHTTYVTGDTITYTFTARNNGNTSLTKVAITDTAFNGSGSLSTLTCDKSAPVTLAPDAKLICTATYVVTQADLNRGNLANTGHAVGTPPTGSNVTDDDSVTIDGDQHSSISLVKTADKSNVVAGQTVTYTFKATNNGNTTLTKAKITDTAFNGSGTLSSLTCDKTAPVTLAPGAVLTCTATYVVTQDDVDRGNVANTGHAVASPPAGVDVTSDDSVTINGTRTSSIDLVKTAGRTMFAVGDTVTYTFKATNTGNTTLTAVAITDTAFNGSGTLSALTCDKNAPVKLAPGAVLTCTATYVASQADVDRGDLANTGHVVATPPSGADVTDDDSVTITSTRTPSINLVKQASTANYAAGDTVTYTLTATNNGTTTLTKVAITDTAFNGSGTLSALSCDKAAPVSLAPGAALTCTATYLATQDDVDRGNLANSGHAVGTPPVGSDVTADASVTISSVQTPSIDLVKRADRTKFAADDTVTYTFTATNTGNTTLTKAKITDTAFNGTGTLSALTCDKNAPVKLAPGAVLTCTATYVASQADLDRGNLVNSAHAVATPPSGTDVFDNDTVTISADHKPGIDLVKTADRTDVVAGQTVTYTFKATNIGNTTLTKVAIADTKFNSSGTLSALTCDKNAPVTLAPHAVLTCKATYVVSQADVDRGNLVNSAQVVATPPSGPDVTASDTVTINGVQMPSLHVVKTANRTKYVAGDTVSYTLTATNDGNTTLTKVAITDTKFNGAGTLGALTCDKAAPVSLAPGAKLVCTVTYVATQADVDRGSLANTGHAVGTPPSGPDLTGDSDVTLTSDQITSLSLNKRVAKVTDVNHDNATDPGDTILWEFDLTNTGNVTLTNPAVDDVMLAKAGVSITCPTGALAPKAKITCVTDREYVITKADGDNRKVVNTATARGNGPLDVKVTSNPDTTTTPAGPTPAVLPVEDENPDEGEGGGGGKKDGDDERLAFTGFNSGWMLGAGALLAFVGAGFIVVTRRRRADQNQ